MSDPWIVAVVVLGLPLLSVVFFALVVSLLTAVTDFLNRKGKRPQSHTFTNTRAERSTQPSMRLEAGHKNGERLLITLQVAMKNVADGRIPEKLSVRCPR